MGGPNAILAVFDTRSAAIDVGGAIYLRGYYNGASDSTDFARIVGGKENNSQPDDSGYLAFRTRKGVYQGDFERLRITSAGNVGIGTAAPGAKLDVNGEIRAATNVVVPSTGRIYLSGAGGARYLADNSTQQWIDVVGALAVGGGFGSTGVTLNTDGTIQTNGNLQVLRNGDPSDVTLFYLGRENMQGNVPAYTNYLFWQNRLNKDGWYWGGWNTFRHPETVKGSPIPTQSVAYGYGYYPFRNLAKNYLFEANGDIATNSGVVGPAVYLQNPKQIDVIDGSAKSPDGFDSNRHPYLYLNFQTTLTAAVSQEDSTQISVNSSANFATNDEVLIEGTSTTATISVPAGPRSEINEIASISGTTISLKRGTKLYDYNPTQNPPVIPNLKKVRELGGVRINYADLAVNIMRSGNELAFRDANNTGGVRLSSLVTGSVDKLRIARGEYGTVSISANSVSADPLATITLPFSFSSEDYVVLLTARNSNSAWGVDLTVKDRTVDQFTVIGRNNYGGSTATFYIQWVAIGV